MRSKVYICPVKFCNWTAQQDEINPFRQLLSDWYADAEEAVKDHLENFHPLYFWYLKKFNKDVRKKYGNG